MKEKNIEYFKENINLIRYEYNKCDYSNKCLMKHELYSNSSLTVFEKDTIWTYINEPIDSPFFMSYDKFLERCKFYEDNSRLYPPNNK